MSFQLLTTLIFTLLVASANGYCPNSCSGNGFCDSKYLVCRCYGDFFGYDCSLRRCPTGRAWGVITGTNNAHSEAECSGKGTCSYASGTCSCQSGFTGHACQYSECPDACTAHGRCVTMKKHATNEPLSRELYDSFLLRYEDVWDADVLYGCECDIGYTGPSCALKICPAGDDPLTTGQLDEIQLIQCQTAYPLQTVSLQSDAPLTAGTFRLNFGKQSTRPMSFNALASIDSNGRSVATSLLALQGVAAVTVTRTDVSATQRNWQIAFPPSNAMHNALVPRWKVLEVQQFICAADGGIFSFTFGNETVRNIPFNADTNTFQTYLNQLSFGGRIDVTLSSGATTICSTSGTYVTLSFAQLWRRDLVGDLPAMTFSKLDAKGVVVTLTLNGGDGFIDTETKELVKGVDTCRVIEQQSFLCAATSGAFALTFEDGTIVSDISFDISATDLRNRLVVGVPYLVDIDVVYSSNITTACTVAGTTITISFVVVKSTGSAGDGDLRELLADQTNRGSNGLAHISNRLQFPTALTEVVKGSVCIPFDQPFVQSPSTQMTHSVDAGGGVFTVAFRGFTSKPIIANASPARVQRILLESLPSLQGVNVSFSGAQACETPTNTMSLTFTQNFGNLPTVVVDGSGLSPGSSIAVAGGGSSFGSALSVDGTKESDSCSNRGSCDDSKLGRCNCYVGYTNSNGRGDIGTLAVNRGDCGALSRIPVACPGELACSGHGTCSGSPSYRCSCAKGWRSGDCSERTCPFGTSWFDYPSGVNVAHKSRTECSSVGSCDRSSGICRCPRPYTGAACELMLCGGASVECSGNGRCLALRDLAPLIKVKGTLAGFSYGEDPNNPLTWDGTKIRSCLCDPSFLGYDCSMRECPRGDDFNTNEDAIERQVIQCTATAGTFMLSFRDEWTTSIRFDATAATVKAALDALNNIEEVTVGFIGGATACSVSTTVITVDFLWELGDLPRLAASTTSLRDSVNGNGLDGSGKVSIAAGGELLQGQASVKGTRENALCSNHGYCDFSTGLCTCDANYGGSDGRGGPGAIANCGFHQLKYVAAAE